MKSTLHTAKTALFAIMLCFGAMVTLAAYSFASPLIADERADVNYWLARTSDGDAVLMDADELKTANQRMRELNADTLIDFNEYPTKFTGTDIKAKIDQLTAYVSKDLSLPKMYKGGLPLTQSYFDHVIDNRNTASLTEIERPILYALTTKRVNLRLLPERAGWFDTADDIHFDNLQQTALDPAEPVAVLSESKDGKYVFVVAYNSPGWVEKSALAFTDRTTWLGYVNPTDFAVVINHKVTVPAGDDDILMQMGSRLPLVNREKTSGNQYLVKIPRRDHSGALVEKNALVSADDFSVGYLPVTENNFVRQAFKFLGDNYGWGGLEDSVDCSAFTADVYRSMGLILPRNSGEQRKGTPSTIDVSNMSNEDKFATLQKFRAGTLFHKKGHVAMYLGSDDSGTPIFIHSLSSYWDDEGGWSKKYVLTVGVTNFWYTNYQGAPMVSDFIAITPYTIK